MKIKAKKAVEAPAGVKAVVQQIVQTPLPELASVLRGFKWIFDKGDIYHWVPVLDHFDSFFEQHTSNRTDVQLKVGEEGEGPDSPFPTESCLAVLSATCVLLENCSNKTVYNSGEHVANLLGAPVPEVVAAALQTLQVLLRKTHHTSVRWAPPAGLSKRLLAMCKGWGGKEEGLDLVVCTSSDETALNKVLHKATTLQFDFSSAQPSASDSTAAGAQITTLQIPGMDSFPESEHDIVAELVRRYKVPAAIRFELLCRVRIAHNFGSLAGRRRLVKQRLMAYNVLLPCSPTAEEYNSLYLAEPDFVSELVALVQAEEAVEEEELRTLALRALAHQLQDRSRSGSVITAVTSGGQSGLLSMLLHKSIASILQQANVPLAPSGSGVLPADVAAAAAGSSSQAAVASPGVAAAAAPPVGSVQYSVSFVDALLTVVAALVQSTSGCQALNDAGIISALLPLLRDTHQDHVGLVCTSLKILEAYMDLSQPASTTFRDLGGLTEVINRLALEVGALPSTTNTTAAAASDSDVVMATAEQAANEQQQRSGGTAPAAESAAAPATTKQMSHNRKTLLKFLLRTIALSSYAPTGNLTATRPQDEDAQLLYASLKEMYSRPDEFGGSLFALAVSVMTDLIHHEPQSFRQLQEAGLPDAFLAAIRAGVVPSGDAIVSIPSALVALCLNSTGLKRVRETCVLDVLIDIFTSKKTMRVLTNDTPTILGSGLEELLRFTPSLRSDGVNVVLGVFKALCILGGDADEIAKASEPIPAEAPVPAEQPAAASHGAAESTAAAAAGDASAAAGSLATEAAAAAPPQPMDTDAPTAADAAAPEETGSAQQAADAPAAAAASSAEGAAPPAAESMEIGGQAQVAVPVAAEPADAAPAVAVQPAAAGAAAAAQAPAPTAAQLAAQRERELERQRQQAEDARLSAIAKRALAEKLKQLVAHTPEQSDIEVFLPLALAAAARMLEPLLTNAETSRMFVEGGGADVLLKLYKLPRLTPVFNFSSASHSLLSVFRALSGSHGAAIASKSKEAVAEQLAILLPKAQELGAVCVPSLPADIRDPYAKQVLVVQGLVALTSAVARNVTAMLPEVSMGTPPLLASMGKLERIVLAQAAASDPWKQARDVAKKEAAAAAESGAAAGATVATAPAAAADEAADAADAAAPVVDNADIEAAEEDMEGAGAHAAEGAAAAEAAAAAPAAAGSNSSSGKQKRTPEDTAYDALSYLITSLRTFYMGTAKAIHTPVRRREEPAPAPTVPMKAAALNLALLLVGNLQLQPWQQPDATAGTAEQPGQAAASECCSSNKQQLDAAVAAVRGRSGHYLRVAEELNQVLFDSRRHYCHLLVLNYFSALGGMRALASCFNDAAELLWSLIDAQEAHRTAQQAADATGDQQMADAQPSSSSTADTGAAAAAPGAAAIAAAEGTAGTKDPRTVMEAVLVKVLSIYEQLANTSVLLGTPQAANNMLAALPNYAGQPLVPPSKDAVQFVNQLHSDILSAVLPLWSHPRAAGAPSGVLTAMIRVLQTCARGPGNASLVMRYQQQGRPAAARAQAQPDAQMVQTIVEMGFSQPRAEEALRRVGANSVELAMEWLINHPEEPAGPAAGGAPAAPGGAGAAGAAAGAAANEAVDEEEELTRALLASLSVVGMSPDAVAQRSQQQQPQQEQAGTTQATDATIMGGSESPGVSTAHTGTAPEAPPDASAAVSPTADDITTPQPTPHPVLPPGAPQLGRPAAAAAVGTAVDDTPVAAPAAEGAGAAAAASVTGLPGPAQLVDGAVRLVAASPSTAFSISDLLVTMAQREDGKGRDALVTRLMDACLPPAAASDPTGASSSSAAAAAAGLPPPGTDILTPARLLLLLLHKDLSSRRAAAKLGLVGRSLQLLGKWQAQYQGFIEAYEHVAAQGHTADVTSVVKTLEVPVWVEAVLMLLDLMATSQLRNSVQTSAAARAEGAAARVAAARAAVAAAGRAAGAPAVAADTDSAEPDTANAAAATAGAPAAEGAAAQQAGATAAARPAAPAAATEPAAPSADAAAAKLPAELSQLPGLSSLLAGWKPCGLLDEDQQRTATSVCLVLLQQLHSYADRWEQPTTSMFEADGSLPNPSAVTQALLQLLAHLTKRHSNAHQVLAAGGHRLLLSLPAACLSPTVSRQDGNIGAILRNLLEDPLTLESWMESEIKNSMTVKGSARDLYTGRPYPYNQANPSSRYTPVATFLSMMSSLVNRDPAVFLQAVVRTCTLETSRGDTMVRLKTAKEMMQPPQQPQQQPQGGVSIPGSRETSAPGGTPAAQPASAAGASGLPRTPAARTTGSGSDAGALATPKPAETAAAGGSDKEKAQLLKSASKASRKLVPGSFVEVIDALLDVVLSYQGAPEEDTKPVKAQSHQPADAGGATGMELDAAAGSSAVAAAPAQPAAAGTAARSTQDVAPLPADLLLRKLMPESREVGLQAMVLRLLTDYCLMFNNSVGLLLKRDSEGGPADARTPAHHHGAQQTPGHHEGRTPGRRSTRGHASSSGGGTGAAAKASAQSDPHKAGVVLRHVMHVQLIDRSGVPAGVPAASGVGANASSLLQAVCIRSGEGRRRVINELVATLTNSRGSDGGSIHAAAVSDNGSQSQWPYISKPGCPSPVQAAACVRLMGALVQSGGAPSRSDPRQPAGSTMPVEVLRAMREAGAVKALTQALQLIDTQHPQAKDAINAILKPLEVLTRPLPKVAVPIESATAAQLDATGLTTWQTPAAPGSRRTAARTTAAAAAAAAPAAHGAAGSAAAAGGSGAAAAAGGSAAGAAGQSAGSAAAVAGSTATPAAATGRSSGESGGRAAMEEDHRQQAGEEAAGPEALAAAGRFVAGGAAQPHHEMPGELIDHLMDQLVDIEVELGADDSELDEDDSESDNGDSDSDEAGDSDEDMAEGQQEHLEGDAAGHGEEGGDAPSLTEEEDHSGDTDDDGAIIMGNAGAAFIDPAAAAAAGANAHDMADLDTSEEDEEPSSDDIDDPEHHHHHHFEDELLAAEEEMHMMQAHMDGHAQEGDGVLDPMDDDEDEEEEEEEYLDEEASDEEGWDQDAMAGALENMQMPGERPAWNLDGLDDLNMPMFLPMGGGFGRMGGRRMMYRPSTTAAAAGVWDDAEGDAAQDGVGPGPMSAVQMLLSQLGINAAGGAGSVALLGPNGRQFRLSAVAMPGSTEASATASQGSEAINGAINSAMQSLTQQLMPQQHRLLALPPGLPAAESMALLASAAGTGAAAEAGAAAGAADAALRGQANNVTALTRLLTRAPESGITNRLANARAQSYLINPQSGLPPFVAPTNMSVWQHLEMLQPGGLAGPGDGGLTRMLAGDTNDSVWDEAVNQLLEALGPPGHAARMVDRHGRAFLPGMNGSQPAGRAGAGAGEDAGVDPRQLESHMLSLLRAQAPPAPPQQPQQQEPQPGAGATAGAATPAPAAAPSQEERAVQQPGAPQAVAAPAVHEAAGTSAPAAAGPAQPPAAAAAASPAAGRRALTEQAIAAAFQAALSDEPIQPAAVPQEVAAPVPPPAAAAAAPMPAAQPQAGVSAAIASHPVDIPPSADTSAPESPTAAAADEAATDDAAPMDTEDAGQAAAPAATEAGAVDAMEIEGAAAEAGAAGGEAGAGEDDAMREALRRAADAAGIDLAFLEALPEELRVEVLSAQGVELRLPQPRETVAPAAAAPSAAAPEPAAAGADAAAASAPAAAAAPDEAGADAAVATGAAAQLAAAEVAAAAPAAGAPAAAAAPAAEQEEPAIDPEFLAALPEDIREEVLAQQRAEQRARAAAARAAARQGQAEMSLADLLAAMDDDARADALTQLSDSDLAQLPSQMRAQAQALRERVARQVQAQQAAQQQQAAAQQQQHDLLLQRQLGAPGFLPGGPGSLVMPLGRDGRPLGLRGLLPGELARLGGADLAGRYRHDVNRAQLLEAAMARAAEEPEGPPVLDASDLVVLVSLLRASLPLSKVHLQKLFLNLAGHSITREQLLKMLLGLLHSLPGSTAGGEAGQQTDADDDMAGSQQERTGMDISDDGTSGHQQQQGLAAALDSLGPVGSRPSSAAAGGQAAAGPVAGTQGKPAIVSRRVLDMLAYLSRQSQNVSRQMLSLRISSTAAQPPDEKGKGKMPAAAVADADAPRALEVLLAMLSAPLCERSVSLLEQLMLLLEVVMTMVQRYDTDQRVLADLQEARKKQEEGQQRKQQEAQEQQPAADAGQAEQAAAGTEQAAAGTEQAAAGTEQAGQQQQQPEAQQPAAHVQQQNAGATAALPAATPFQQEGSKDRQQQQGASSSKQKEQPPGELATSLASIQPSLLQQLPGLLAREALSEPAYVSIAKVIKLIVESAPSHLPLMLSMLVEGAAGVAQALLGFLDAAAERGIDADAQLAPAIGTKSGVVLRMLHALQGFQAEVKEWLKQQQDKEKKEKQAQEAAAGATTAAGPISSSQASAQMGPSSSRAAAAAGGSSGAEAGSSSSAVQLPSNLDPAEAASEVDKAVSLIATRTAPLWKSLSRCILRIEDNLRAVLPQHMQAAGESAGNAAARLLPPGAQQVLPLVEAFFVLCALQDAIPPPLSHAKDLLSAPSLDVSLLSGGTAAAATAASGGSAASLGSGDRAVTPPPAVPSASQLRRLESTSLLAVGAAGSSGDGSLPFLRFAERHRRLLNAYIRRNTGLLESSLAPLLRVPKLIDFDNKRAYFRSRVRSVEDRGYAGSLRLAVKRHTVFEDSFNKLRSKTPAEMRGKLSVTFVGEEGIDAGGVSREWYQVMAREIFNPNLALFVSVPEGGTTFQPNPNSIVQSDTGVSHLEFFKFVGRLVGKALYDGQIMDAYFTRSFYKHMLGQPLTYEDIEAVDPEYYKNLKWMLENDITDVLDLTFTAESDFFGKTEVVELVAGGREIKVTEANKHEYVNLIARHRMTTSIKTQIQAFLEGFWQLVPRELISIFNDHELELLISGLPDIDVADLRANTEYTGFSPNSPVIQWFWQVVADMDKQDLALLLQFVTGTSKVPLGGFRSLQGISGPQRFQIHKSYGATDRLPSAHTCFNQLDLPEYESKEQLTERLAMAIHEGHEGFGFG